MNTDRRRGPPSPSDVAVIVPHYDDAARLARCLDALRAAEGAGEAEIIVVDNASPGDPATPICAERGVRMARETRKGAAHARNRGVADTRGAALFFLDADCVPAPDWLAAGRAALGRFDIVGGAVEVFDETPPPRSGAEAFEAVFAFDQETYIRRKGFSVSANLLTWRAVFEDVGGFRDGVSEDLDWCRRAGARGWRIDYAPGVRVAHPARADFAELLKKMRRVERETHALGASRRFDRLRRGLRAIAMAGSPLAHTPRVLRSPRLRGPGERMRAVAVLFRVRLIRAGWILRQALGLPI